MVNEEKQDFKMIGYLDNINDVRIDKYDRIYICLKNLTDVPDSISSENDDIFNGHINVGISSIKSIPLSDSKYQPEDSRKEYVWNELNSLLFEITPVIKRKDDKNIWWAEDVQVKKRNQSLDPKDINIKLIPLPFFSTANSYKSIDNKEEFKSNLVGEQVLIEQDMKWSKNEGDIPEAIIWGDDEQHITLYQGIDKQYHTDRATRYRINEHEFASVDLSSEETQSLKELSYKFNNILYVPSDVFYSYLNRTRRDDSIRIFERDNSNIENSEGTDVISNDVLDLNNKILETLKCNTADKNLYYTDSDLVNFHVSMKAEGMVILSGLSGTGKSKLVSEYANVLGITDSKVEDSSQLQFISVRPFWADDSDLLGYADTVNNVYRPGDSGLIDTLITAQNNLDKLFIIVFDEMNLARVEHYFSQFLSVLEMAEGTKKLTLYNPQLEKRLYNSEKYPSTISIGENILFVGTVNADESTYQFSDKVLDRSNVITLEMVPFNQIAEFNGLGNENITLSNICAKDFDELKKNNKRAKLAQSEKEMLWELHQAINKIDKNIGIGWRIVKQINNYLINIPLDDNTYSRQRAFDMQIVQRVLTKVRGSEEQIRTLVGSTQLKDTNDSHGELADIFDKYSDTSHFEKSREILARKARELDLYGFTV